MSQTPSFPENFLPRELHLARRVPKHPLTAAQLGEMQELLLYARGPECWSRHHFLHLQRDERRRWRVTWRSHCPLHGREYEWWTDEDVLKEMQEMEHRTRLHAIVNPNNLQVALHSLDVIPVANWRPSSFINFMSANGTMWMLTGNWGSRDRVWRLDPHIIRCTHSLPCGGDWHSQYPIQSTPWMTESAIRQHVRSRGLLTLMSKTGLPEGLAVPYELCIPAYYH